MALQDANLIVQAYQNALAQQQRAEEFAQDRELRERQLEQQREEFGRQADRLDAAQKAAEKWQEFQKSQLEAQHALQKSQFGLQAAQLYSTTGIVPHGAEVVSQAQQVPIPGVEGGGVQGPFVNIPGPTLPSTLTPQAPRDITQDLVNLNIPGVGTVQAPTPEALAARQAILARPAEEARKREQEALQQSELKRMQALHDQQFADQLSILGRQERFAREQQDKNIAAQKSLQDSRLANQITVQGMKSSGALSGFGGTMATDDEGNPTYVPNDPTDIINKVLEGAQNGTLSQEQIKTRWPVSKIAGQSISAALEQRGIQPLSNKQMDKLRELEQISSLTSDLYQIHKLRVDHPLLLQFPMSDVANSYNTLEEKIKGELAGASKLLNNVPRFTNVELNKVSDMLLPSRDIFGHTGSKEFSKYEGFVKDLQNYFNTTLSDVPESQRNVIRQRMGLNNFPYIGNTIQAPGTPTPQIGGAVQPSQRLGGEQNRIRVKRKFDGQVGTILPQDFDPKKYEKLGQ